MEEKEEMTTLNLRISKDLRKEFKKYCIDNEKNMTELILEFIRKTVGKEIQDNE